MSNHKAISISQHFTLFSLRLSDPAVLTKTESKGGRGDVGERDLRLQEHYMLSESTMVLNSLRFLKKASLEHFNRSIQTLLSMSTSKCSSIVSHCKKAHHWLLVMKLLLKRSLDVNYLYSFEMESNTKTDKKAAAHHLLHFLNAFISPKWCQCSVPISWCLFQCWLQSRERGNILSQTRDRWSSLTLFATLLLCKTWSYN